jgi:Flp pilus assembly protein TadD
VSSAAPPAPAAAEPRSTWRVVALVALLVRLLYLAEHAGSAFFTTTVLDGRYFELFARGLARGEAPAELATGFRPLLYPLLLAPLFALFGDAGVVVAQILQHGAGVVTAVAVATLARRLTGDESSALAAGLLYALAPVPLFFEGELLVESCFGALAAVLLLALAAGRHDPARLAFAGALLGLAAQLRPNALLLLAALPFALARGRLRGRGAAAFAGGCAAVVALAALLQAPLVGAFRILPGAGAVNLYLGNERGADGLVPRQDFAVVHGDAYRDSVELFAEAAYRRELVQRGEAADRALDPAELDRYWIGRTAAELAADPAGRLALLGRKAVVLVWNGEVPNNRSFDFAAREESRLLRSLPARFALLFALALAGVAASRPGPPRFWTLAFAFAHGAGVVLYFVADRYRLPLAVPAAAFAGCGLAALVRAARARRPRELTRLAALALAGAALSAVDWTGARERLPGPARDLHFRSIARLENGDPAGALADAERAALLEPADPHHATQVAAAALAAGDLARAEAALARAVQLAPDEPRIRNALGVAAERRNRPDEARARYREALDRSPEFAPALLNLAWLELRSGRPREAAELAARLPASGPAGVQELMLRAGLASAAGDPAAAARLRAEADALSAESAAALERELSAPSTSRR